LDQSVAAIRQQLMASNDSFRQLATRHTQLETRLSQLKERRYLTSEEELEEVRLKKLKLHIKDEMEEIVRRELGQLSAAS
jgi:uncharacterized protein YdcH (DUF465 family)